MSDAPERIWAWEIDHSYDPAGYYMLGEGDDTTEYIRADLSPQWQPIESAPENAPTRIWCGKAMDAELDMGTWYIADPSNKGRLTLEFFGVPTHWKYMDDPPTE